MAKLLKSCSARCRRPKPQKMPRMLELRFEFILAVHGIKYSFQNKCPKCNHGLTFDEVCKGFCKGANDFNTSCPKCGRFLQPKLIWKKGGEKKEEILFSPAKVKRGLHGLERFSPAHIRPEYPSLYHSAICHFGTLGGAFCAKGVDYNFFEGRFLVVLEQFFGKMPDSKLARLSGVSTESIRQLRKAQGIKPYNARSSR